jgi:hypothetical protein
MDFPKCQSLYHTPSFENETYSSFKRARLSIYDKVIVWLFSGYSTNLTFDGYIEMRHEFLINGYTVQRDRGL